MKVFSGIAETRTALTAARGTGNITVGLVPTMGALHAGHVSLVRAARECCDVVAVSIFVNPTQFGPNEDLERYPRTLGADCDLLRIEGVDLVFAPSAKEMYPTGCLRTSVDPGDIGNRLDGRSRPGHFRGVCTVVSKLFAIAQPDQAFFGQKDAAQVAVLRAMVRDLNLPVRMNICPTVREADGLAMSSRNRYLTAAQRRDALALSHALTWAEQAVARGEGRTATLLACMRERLEVPGLRVDYVEAVDPDSLLPVLSVHESTLLALAAWAGETRLIDNRVVRLQAAERGR